MSNTYSDGTTPKVCVIGTGFCGLCAAIKLKTELDFKDIVIYERNKDVGGIWFANTYPGCCTDVSSHFYSFSFELNPNWSKHYAPAAEYQQYFSRAAKKYDIYSHIKLQTEVRSTVWVDVLKKWRVTSENRVTKEVEIQLFDLVVNGCGALRYPKIPEEFKQFKGPMWHSARWDHSVDLSNKIVGVVGNGASAVQIIPSIAPKVKELHVFQWRLAWVVGREQFDYPKIVQELFALIPFLLWLYRAYIFIKYEIRHHMFSAKSYFIDIATKDSMDLIKTQITYNKTLQEAVTPRSKFGCKRLLVTNDYYPALNMPHCTVHTDIIKKVEGNSITMENGVTQELDILILANVLLRMNSRNILDKWVNDSPPRVYYGIVDSEAPDQFFFIGPNTALLHSSAFFMAECQVSFMIQLIREMMARDAKTVAVKEEAVQEYITYLKKHVDNTVWGHVDCGG